MSTFSEQLKNYIKKSGLTQSELAKIAGISDSYISKACKGIRIPTENVIIEILLALRLPTDIFNNLLNQYRIEFFCNKFKTDFYTLETIKNFCKNIGYMPTLPINFNIYNTIPNVNSLRNPNNINSRYYNIYSLSFFPRKKRTSNASEIEKEILKKDNFYTNREMKLQMSGQLSLF